MREARDYTKFFRQKKSGDKIAAFLISNEF